MNNALLEIKNLNVRYQVEDGWLSAVHDVSMHIDKGEFFALVGESGCGKSTIASTIMRLSLDHNERIDGQILFGGRDLVQATEPEMEQIRGSGIGMIFQNPLDSLNPVYTVGFQIDEALRAGGMDAAAARRRTIELMEAVRIPGAAARARSFPHELSGGMRQRVMIAMMLSRSPQLLIADEPTTALDVTVEAQILEIMKNMRNQFGASVLMITHNFGIVAETADRVGIMYAGELVECGDVYDIFSHPAHPYSRALMGSLPRQRKQQGRIQTIEGTVPRILGDSQGCRFANRCPRRAPQCETAIPPVHELGNGHWVRCHMEVDA